ncbi:ROK family protein [Actinoallomurus sp. NBC_01490]|uniref:ROK family transcriptional regulator n=1 Tax=Actinoallomurus sp. NBC_01490 TaxID=2903557 RepID=UPI002E34845E|nr:ROK family protein [Actinoallomurus sp. NBC_01490]
MAVVGSTDDTTGSPSDPPASPQDTPAEPAASAPGPTASAGGPGASGGGPGASGGGPGASGGGAATRPPGGEGTTRPDLAGAASPGHLLALIRTRPGWTRQQLLTATGMSRTTLFERLDQLFRAGLVYESGSTGATVGRPARLVRFDDRNRVALIFDLGQTHGRIAVADLFGRTLRMATLRLNIAQPPDRLLPDLLDRADKLLRVDENAQVVGVGMGIPGPVDVATGRLGASTTMPGWEDYAIKDVVRSRWDVPLLIENDARAFARGEASASGGRGILLAVKYASGIGAGIVVNGEVIGGADGAAGDIGHIRVSDEGPVCRCGRQGCLAAWASGWSLLDQLADQGVHTLDDVVQMHTHNPAVIAALRAGAERLGRVLAAVVATVNPDTLVLGGILGQLPLVAEEVERWVRADAVERTMQKLRVITSRSGDDSATVGLTLMVAQHVLAASAIDAALGVG